MNVVVIGATGQTGKHIVRLLVDSGQTVTAFARDPNQVDTLHGVVRVVSGDARDTSAVASALAGQDAVVSAIGPRSLKKDDLQEVFMGNVTTAMEQEGIRRFIGLSARGAGDSIKQSNLLMKTVRNTLLKNIYDDKDRGETRLIDSAIDYTLVRPGRLSNKPATGQVRASSEGKGLRTAMSREDVASYMVSQLNDTSWIRKCPLIGY
jgi:uncharacterized protein YbjT (DUF2867 family)